MCYFIDQSIRAFVCFVCFVLIPPGHLEATAFLLAVALSLQNCFREVDEIKTSFTQEPGFHSEAKLASRFHVIIDLFCPTD